MNNRTQVVILVIFRALTPLISDNSFINTTIENYGIFEAIRICSLKILNKITITGDAKINNESFSYEETTEEVLDEEYEKCLKMLKEFL